MRKVRAADLAPPSRALAGARSRPTRSSWASFAWHSYDAAACRPRRIAALLLVRRRCSAAVCAATRRQARRAMPTRSRPSRSASSHIATTRERPVVDLLFRRVSSLDFRVYRVNDPLEVLRRPARPARARQRGAARPAGADAARAHRAVEGGAPAARSCRFLRGQFSHDYRVARRETAAKAQIALRQPLEYRQFAQVPLLNRRAAGHLVARAAADGSRHRGSQDPARPARARASTSSKPSAAPSRPTPSSSCPTSASSPRRRPASS